HKEVFCRATHSLMGSRLQQIRMPRCDTAERIARTRARNRALIAMQAPIMADLQKQRAIAKVVAPLHAFGATNAQSFVDYVLVIRVFDKAPFDGRRGTKLILRGGRQLVRFSIEEPGAKLAIATNGERMHAFDRRLLEHALRRAIAAMQALGRIDLPNRLPACAVREGAAQRADARHCHQPRSIAQKLSSRNWFGLARIRFHFQTLRSITRTSP